MAKRKLEVLNVKQFSELMDVSPATVGRWIDGGKISQKSIEYTPSGKPNIIVEYAVDELAKKHKIGAVRKTRGGYNLAGNTAPKTGATPPLQNAVDTLLGMAGVKPDGTITLDGADMSQDPTTFEAAKIQEQIGKAMLIKLNVAEKRGELVDKREQDNQLRDLGITLKSDLATVADRVAANCFAAESELEVRNIIHGSIEQVLLKYSGKVW